MQILNHDVYSGVRLAWKLVNLARQYGSATPLIFTHILLIISISECDNVYTNMKVINFHSKFKTF